MFEVPPQQLASVRGLGTGNALREDASKHKKRVLIKVYQDFLATLLSLIVLYSD